MSFHRLLILSLIVLLSISYALGYVPAALGVSFMLASSLTYFLYARDKAAAIAGSWRISENTLHLVSVLFGWPGALIAQERLRHKTQKQSFRTFFWLTVLLNLSAIAWFHSPQGNSQLREFAEQVGRFATSTVSSDAAVNVVLFLMKFRADEI